MEIKIKYHDEGMEKVAIIKKGDFIDLRSQKDIELKQGEFTLIPLGVSIKLPEGYFAMLVPRSSTFKNYGIIQTNSVGIIDESYAHDDDIWMMPVYATRDTFINKNDRICQFGIFEKAKDIQIIEVDHLDTEEARGGFGSTGVQ